MIINNNLSTIKIKTLEVKNFKSFEHLIIELDTDFNVFTGINNSGKTNLLEAINFVINKTTRYLSKGFKTLVKFLVKYNTKSNLKIKF